MDLSLRTKIVGCFVLCLVAFLAVQLLLISSFRASFLLASLVGLLLAAGLAALFAKALSRPADQLVRITRRLTPELDHDPMRHRDEMLNLSRAIHEMANQLRKKIEDISREKENVQAVLKGMMEGVLVVDERGRIVMVNEAFRAFFLLPADVSDRLPLEIVRNAHLESSIQEVLREGKHAAFDIEVPAVGKTLQVNVVPAIDITETGKSDRKVRGAIAVFHDITRLKQLEKVRKDFVANVSHELRTPLTTIKGYAETLLGGGLEQESAVRFLQVINRHADRLTKIVEDLLTLSRFESKELQLNAEPISVSEWVENCIEIVKESADQKGITLTHAIPLPLGIRGDRDSLEQALVNLLDNAVKYGREGGKVNVAATETAQGRIQISVSDDGIGIPREDLGRIFERFYRVDKDRSRELGGTGLGLSIVNHIVKVHGGEVWAESQPGKGSVFHMVFPKALPKKD